MLLIHQTGSQNMMFIPYSAILKEKLLKTIFSAKMKLDVLIKELSFSQEAHLQDLELT